MKMNENPGPRKHFNFDSHDDYQPAAKKLKTREFLNFADPPKSVFDNLKIPHRTDDYLPIPVISSLNTFSSSVPPPFPLLENNLMNVDEPVTKAVLDSITGKINKPTPKLQYFRCQECNLFLSSQISLDTHQAGARHVKKLKELEISSVVDNLKKEKVKKISEHEYKCKLCDVNAGSLVQIKSHIDGSKHKKKMNAYREEKNKKHKSTTEEVVNSSVKKTVSTTVKMDTDGSNTNSSTGKKNKPVQSFLCSICSLSMNSQLQYDQHISSKKHISKAAKLSNAVPVVSTNDHP